MKPHRHWLILLLLLSACVPFRPAPAPDDTLAPSPSPTLPPAAPTITPAAPAPVLTPTSDYRQGFQPQQAPLDDCAQGGWLQSVQALAYDQVRFTLCHPDASFLSRMAMPAYAIYPQEWVKQAHQAGFDAGAPIGTGAYRVEAWDRGHSLTFQRWDASWKQPALAPARLIFRWDLDAAARLVELQAGTAQGIDNLSPDDFATVQNDPQARLIARPALNIAYLGLNMDLPPLDNALLRQALAVSLDRQALVDQTFPQGYQRADYFAPCALPYACLGDAWPEFDARSGGDLLKQAGFGPTLVLPLSYRRQVRSYLPHPDETAHAIQRQLEQNLGIQVRLQPMEDDAFYAALDSGQLAGLHLLGWGADYPDVSNFLDTHFGGMAGRQFGSPFPDLVSVLDKAAATVDGAERAQAYAQANALIRRQVPVIPLAQGGWVTVNSTAVAYSSQVETPVVSPLGVEDFSLLRLAGAGDFTWMQAAEPLTLYCPQALLQDVESLRACAQIADPLYHFTGDTLEPQPALAQTCVPNAALTEWTCSLRVDVFFQDGSRLDANDVVESIQQAVGFGR